MACARWWSAFAPTPARRSPLRPKDSFSDAFLHANRFPPRIKSGAGLRLKALFLLPFSLLLAEAHLFRELRTRHGIIRCDHRIVDRQPPFLAILLGRHVVLGAQMALQRLESLAVL